MVTLDGEPLSPELVLVSPDLAARARALLPDGPMYPPRRLEAPADETGAGVQVASADGIGPHDDHLRIARRLAQLELAAEIPRTDEERRRPRGRRRREPWIPAGVVASAAIVVSIVAAMVAVELLPPLEDRPRLAWSGGAAPTTRGPEEESTAAPTDVVVPPSASVPQKRDEPEEPPRTAPTAPQEVNDPAAPRTPPRPATTGVAEDRPTGTETGSSGPPSGSSGADTIVPARVFLWPAAEGATFYTVSFLRNERRFYSARVSKPRLVLPDTVELTPGAYRWTVRPGFADLPLGDPIVESSFRVAAG